jgi:SOS response regulatory protein OraA/RecX
VNLFDPDHLGTITHLVGTKDGWISIFADEKRVARVPRGNAERLGLANGAAWTRPLESACKLAAETWRAKRKGAALIRVRPRGSAELRTRLADAGFSPEAATAAVVALAGEGLVDDAALAQVTAARASEKGLSAGATAARLGSRGLADAAPKLVDGGTDLERAIEVVRNRAAKLPESLTATTRANRLLGALSRLGYDEDTAREAVQRVLGFQNE